jgi:hypothetical protein
VFDNIDKQAQVIAYAKSKGVPIMIGDPGARTVQETASEEQANEDDAEDNDDGEQGNQNGN